MRAGQTILMIAPGDTQPTAVPREFAAKMREAGAKFYTPSRAPSASILDRAAAPNGGPGPAPPGGGVPEPVQRGVDALADIGGGIGGFMGVTPHQRAGNAARFGVAGRATSHVINSLTGVDPAWTPQQAAETLGKEAALQSSLGYTGEATAKLGKMLAEPVMKSAIGRSAIGTAKRALKYGLAPTEKFLAQTTEKIGKLKDSAIALAKSLEGKGHTSTFDELAKPLRAEMARFKKHDVTGGEAERAMQSVLDEMEAKIGPKTVTTPGGPAVGASAAEAADPNASLRGVYSAQWQKPTTTQIPAKPLTPTQLQEIAQIARQKLTDLFEARQAVKGVGGAPPDPRERAYMKVWARSKQLLEGMGGEEGKQIGRVNKEMQRLYQMHSVARKAGEKAFPQISPYESLGAATIAAGSFASGHPEAAVFAIPAAIGRPLLTRPDALAAQARFLNSETFGNIARVTPRAAVAGTRQLLSRPKKD